MDWMPLLYLVFFAIAMYVLWGVIRSAVLSALTEHAKREAIVRERERLEQDVRTAEKAL